MLIRNKPLGIVVTKLTEQMSGDPMQMFLDFRSVGHGLISIADFSARDLLETLDTLDDQQLEDLARATDPLIIDVADHAAA